MQYRNFSKLDWKPSALGFGVMRLPVIGNDQAKVDIPEAIAMMRYAIDNGVNYLDTAYYYHGGHAEKILAATLRDGYRQKVKIATKFPFRSVKTPDDFDRLFAEQLANLETDRVDFYLLHGLKRLAWETIRDMGVIPWMEKQVAAGRIGYIGFSFHDEYDVFKAIVDYYDNWTFCQLQYNYMDVNFQAGRKGVEYAAAKGLAIIIMEPLRGGQLAKEPPENVKRVWETDGEGRSPVEWSFRWLWDQPEISLLLSGMSTMQQVVQNVEIAGRAGNSHLQPPEKELIERARQAYQGLSPIPCTGCGYCQPCPNDVEIPEVFRLYNTMKMYGETQFIKSRYRGRYTAPEEMKREWGVTNEKDASHCVECGNCLELCPQHLDIPELLKKAHQELTAD